jgi:hypothetical protein
VGDVETVLRGRLASLSLEHKVGLLTGADFWSLSYAFEPEAGFEPTTFRLRARCFQSNRSVLVGSCLLTLDAASAWSGPDGSSRIDWMTIGMTKAHSILDRMRRRSVSQVCGR